jgi:hypothetical protein
MKPGASWQNRPGTLRWTLYEAAMSAAKKASPNHEYFFALRERLGAQ